MKTFKDFTDKEIRELIKKQEDAIKQLKKQNETNNILLFGIGSFGNKIISNVKDMSKVTKIFSDVNEKYLEKYDKNDILLFLKGYKLSEDIWDKNNYSKIYKYLIANKEHIAEKIKSYDYIIICTRSNYKMDACLAEAVADTCNETKKRFMICHSTDVIFPNLEKISKRRSVRFINKMKKKKYLLNEIAKINTCFVCDNVDVEYQGKIYSSLTYTNYTNIDSDFNIKVFARAVEYNIIKMLEV